MAEKNTVREYTVLHVSFLVYSTAALLFGLAGANRCFRRIFFCLPAWYCLIDCTMFIAILAHKDVLLKWGVIMES